MRYRFAQRMSVTPKSYIMELISICQDPEIISFSSGLPDIRLIPMESISNAAQKLLSTEDGRSSLQYSITEGYLPLREFIADRYHRRVGLDLDPQDIILVNGSQQCFDLVGKVLLDKGSAMIMERPGYLGAVQSFCIFEPEFHHVDLHENGPDIALLSKMVSDYQPRLFYSVPNSQNPMGITYSLENRGEVADVVGGTSTVILEDDAYGELSYDSIPPPPLATMVPDNVVITGSFSKIFSPGMRCGWIAGPREIMEKVTIAKEASDLHSNYLSQRIIYQWLQDNDLDSQIEKINQEYRSKRDLMIKLLDELMPEGVEHTNPSGGLFIWFTLPKGSTMELFNKALQQKVAIMPGPPFFADGGGENGARLNFSASTMEEIEEGIRRLAEVTTQYLTSLSL